MLFSLLLQFNTAAKSNIGYRNSPHASLVSTALYFTWACDALIQFCTFCTVISKNICKGLHSRLHWATQHLTSLIRVLLSVFTHRNNAVSVFLIYSIYRLEKGNIHTLFTLQTNINNDKKAMEEFLLSAKVMHLGHRSMLSEVCYKNTFNLLHHSDAFYCRMSQFTSSDVWSINRFKGMLHFNHLIVFPASSLFTFMSLGLLVNCCDQFFLNSFISDSLQLFKFHFFFVFLF